MQVIACESLLQEASSYSWVEEGDPAGVSFKFLIASFFGCLEKPKYEETPLLVLLIIVLPPRKPLG